MAKQNETTPAVSAAAPLYIEVGLKKSFFGMRFNGKTATSAEVKFLEFSDGFNDQLELHWTGGLSGYNKTGMDETRIADIIRHFGTDATYRVFGEIVSGGYFLTYNFYPVSEIGKKDITSRKARRRGIDDTPAETASAQ
jgi:hypothetical protein